MQLRKRTEAPEEIDEDMPMTLKELKAFMAKEKENADCVKRSYDNNYIKEFLKLSEAMDEEKFADAVMTEMEKNFNSVYSKRWCS